MSTAIHQFAMRRIQRKTMIVLASAKNIPCRSDPPMIFLVLSDGSDSVDPCQGRRIANDLMRARKRATKDARAPKSERKKNASAYCGAVSGLTRRITTTSDERLRKNASAMPRRAEVI